MKVRALLLLLVVVLASPPRFSTAEESKPETKGETPAPAAEEKKPDEAKKAEPKAEQGPTGEFDPKTVSGTAPAYPLKTENMKDIYDDYSDQDDQTNMEPAAKQDIFEALFASSQDYLVKNINQTVKYVDMMNHSDNYRGEVVRITGILRYMQEMECDPSKYKVKKYWKGMMSVGAKEIKTFIALEPPTPDVKIGVPVDMVGIFMKRFAYLNKEPGEKLTVTPLIIGRRIERTTTYELPAETWMNSWQGLTIFGFVGVSVAVFFWTRINARGRYANKFTRMKEERKGPQGNFPRPG
jgi:hypothetical protein